MKKVWIRVMNKIPQVILMKYWNSFPNSGPMKMELYWNINTHWSFTGLIIMRKCISLLKIMNQIFINERLKPWTKVLCETSWLSVLCMILMMFKQPKSRHYGKTVPSDWGRWRSRRAIRRPWRQTGSNIHQVKAAITCIIESMVSWLLLVFVKSLISTLIVAILYTKPNTLTSISVLLEPSQSSSTADSCSRCGNRTSNSSTSANWW